MRKKRQEKKRSSGNGELKMTINKRFLCKWSESMRRPISSEQEKTILERFGTEPEPYEWGEQDIHEQILSYLCCGKFTDDIWDFGPPLVSDDGIEF